MNAGNRAKELVAQIMTFSRRTEQKMQPVETGCIVKESLKLLRASLPSTIDIQRHIDPAAGVILADPTQIHQVIINLCTNAYQALKKKRAGRIDVSLTRAVFGAGRAAPHADLKHDVEYQELAVRDTGHGIEPAIIHRIFDPFFTTKKTGEGTGLGLAVVYGIVQGHGGAVTVDSTPGQGTTFRLFIPTINRQRIDTYEQKQTLLRGNERIVFVDDEASLTYIYRVQLENLGYNVRDFNDPLKVLSDFRRKEMDCDLVITDRSMPHMDGLALAHAIIGIRPDLPIILCTGTIEALDQVLLEKAGIRKVLTKPITIEVMAQAIRQSLEKR
jgi:CheY-like chemotaxis protein